MGDKPEEDPAMEVTLLSGPSCSRGRTNSVAGEEELLKRKRSNETSSPETAILNAETLAKKKAMYESDSRDLEVNLKKLEDMEKKKQEDMEKKKQLEAKRRLWMAEQKKKREEEKERTRRKDEEEINEEEKSEEEERKRREHEKIKQRKKREEEKERTRRKDEEERNEEEKSEEEERKRREHEKIKQKKKREEEKERTRRKEEEERNEEDAEEEERKRREHEKIKMKMIKDQEDDEKRTQEELREAKERRAQDLEELKEGIRGMASGRVEMQERLFQIINECGIIENATGQVRSGRLTFLREDQATVNDSLRRITNVVHELVKEIHADTISGMADLVGNIWMGVKVGMEECLTECMEKGVPVGRKGKRIRVEKTTDSEAKDTTDDEKVKHDRQAKSKKSYASAAAVGTSRERQNPFEGRVMSGPKWKTPEKPKHEAIIRREGQTDGREVMKEVKGKLKDVIKEGVKGARITPGGAVIIEGRDHRQIEKIMVSLKTDTDLSVRTGKVNSPKIRILGVEDVYDEDGATRELWDQNEDLRNQFSQEEIDKTRVVKIQKWRDNRRSTWIVETCPNVAKTLIRQGEVVLDLVCLPVKEHMEVTQCFNCCMFGHVAKYCKHSAVCYLCSGPHDGKTCKEQNNSCINCEKAKIPPDERRHGARDMMCPVLNRQMELSRRRVDFYRT